MKRAFIKAVILAWLVFIDTTSAGTSTDSQREKSAPAAAPGASRVSAGVRESADLVPPARAPVNGLRAGHGPGLRTASILIGGCPYPRVITPNGDNVNDRVFFFFETTDAAAEGKIYDLAGAFVAKAKPGPVLDGSLVWDGKDEQGNVVPMGVYLYRVTIAGESTTGTIVVAR